MQAFYAFIEKNLTYPKEAKRMTIEGKVFVQFVVDEQGSLTEVEVVKGIGAGCDEEAVRIIKNQPTKWTPGEQRGKPTKIRMILPITFKLR
ncbi:MAG: energy transducer TonB [Chitinophagaceae bacterium]|nr:energy transducer TonB [Chitinophagaceae bacterium]